ncbi:hypothetical protein C8Q78DRAFT_497885 [Trametes maxima]|nr:hypothetical protein C8Q78DRAFT_497885 [Trametes maxima]
MMTSRFHSLPTELVVKIARALALPDLGSLLLVDTASNLSLTPLLYSSVAVKDVKFPQRYDRLSAVRTLAKSPEGTSFGRDLTSLIRKFYLDLVVIFDHERNILPILLAAAIPRMNNVHHFSCDLGECFTPAICVGILQAAASSLRTLRVANIHNIKYRKRVTPLDSLPTPPAHFSRLHLVDLPHFLSPDNIRLFAGLLQFAADQLHVLTLSVNTWRPQYKLSSLFLIPSFPNLHTLDIGLALLIIPELPAMPRVRSLRVRPTDSRLAPTAGSPVPPGSIPASAFPALERIACAFDVFPLFLGEHAIRPISIIELDNASYQHNLTDRWNVPIVPSWDRVQGALRDLRRASNTPLTSLSIGIHRIDFGDLPKVVPYVEDLEYLLVMLGMEPSGIGMLASLGEHMIARMPRLHTLLFSDGRLKLEAIRTRGTIVFTQKEYSQAEPDASGFSFAQQREWQRDVLHEFGRHSRVLRRVAFTTEFQWVKTDEGWEAVEEECNRW